MAKKYVVTTKYVYAYIYIFKLPTNIYILSCLLLYFIYIIYYY